MQVSFPPKDSEDNWQWGCDLTWILETAICIRLYVYGCESRREGDLFSAFANSFCVFTCLHSVSKYRILTFTSLCVCRRQPKSFYCTSIQFAFKNMHFMPSLYSRWVSVVTPFVKHREKMTLMRRIPCILVVPLVHNDDARSDFGKAMFAL